MLWYRIIFSKEIKGDSFLVVHADDFIVGFQYKWEAEKYYEQLRRNIMLFRAKWCTGKSTIINILCGILGYDAGESDYKGRIVKAGAGCGKTTLLSSFVEETKMENVKWMMLDENANQTFVFWNYVIEVVKEYLGDTKGDFQTFFDNNMQKIFIFP